MATIDYFLFPLSPYAYLAGLRLEEIAARHAATVVYKPFQLLQVYAVVGTAAVADRHPSKRETPRSRAIWALDVPAAASL